MFKQYQEVQLTRDLLSDKTLGRRVKLHQGQHGIIVEIHEANNMPTGFDVEFFDDSGETVALMIVLADDIEPMRQDASSHQVA